MLLASLALAPSPAPNPAAAIAVAAGHPARLHLRGTATTVRDGRTHVDSLDVAGTRRLTRRCERDLCVGTWFDGRQMESFGLNGAPLPESDADNPALRTYAAIVSTGFGEAPFTAAGGRVSREPGAGPEERFRVAAPGGSELIAVADTRTHRLLQVERPDGTMYAQLVASGTHGTVLYAALPFTDVTPVADPLVAPTPPTTTVGPPRDIPLLAPDQPVLPCTVAGVQARCLLDTGSTPSAVTLEFAEKLGLEPHGEIVMAALGTYLTGVIEAGPVGIGNATIAPLHLAVIPSARGLAFDVVVGSDALTEMRVELDPHHHRARLFATGAPPQGSPLALRISGGLPYIDVRLGDSSETDRALFDTGDSGTLSIGYDRYRSDLSLFAARTDVTAIGLGGTMDAVRGEIAHAMVGDKRLTRVEIRAVRGQHGGHVGYGFAVYCGRIAIDLGRSRVDCLGPPEQ